MAKTKQSKEMVRPKPHQIENKSKRPRRDDEPARNPESLKTVPIRCKTNHLLSMNSKIEASRMGQAVKQFLYDSQFHGLMEVQVSVVDKELLAMLIDSFDMAEKKFRLGGRLLSLEASDVGRVYCLPTQGKTVNPKICRPKAMSTLRRQLGLRHTESKATGIDTKDLYALLDDTIDPNAYAKLYILIALGELLAVGSNFSVSLGYASALTGTAKDISQFNWGQLVVDTIVDAMVELKSGQRATYPAGDYNFAVVSSLHYLSCVYLGD
ncbi:hypothetical protein LINPERPRIM_LOCUS14607 [Linum perenne]